MSDPETKELLRQILTRLDELAGHKAPGKLSRVDCETLIQLLPRINSEIGDEAFAIRDSMTQNPELRRAIEATVGRLDPDKTKTLGRLLARAVGHALNGYTVQRLGRARAGVLWRVSVT